MPATAVAPARPFEFRCLGPVLLTRCGGERVRLRTRKQFALLLLLARRQGLPVSRDDLIELLWSEDGESNARHSLSQSISLINKQLGSDAIEPCQKNQLLLRDGTVWLDVAEFEAAIADGRSADAQALWRGGLFEGQWIPRAPSFERWLADERDRLARQLRAALREVLEGHRTAGDWQPMRRVAEALLDVDALDEGAMLAYLEALTLHGERTLALRRYGEFERRLREELDAEPGSALRGWIRRNRKGEGDRPAPAAVPIPRVSDLHILPAVRPVYGRQEEFATLWERWETAQRSGEGTFLIMQGEAGIGKSELAGKLLNQVHVGGGSVCLARCYRTEKSVPFAPITALIRQLSRLPGFVALGDVWIGELTRLVPELRQRFPNAPQPMAIDESARHRLSDGVVQATECVADEQPLLVVVDDIQDADEASLALLHYLGRSVATQPIFLICIARAGVQLSEFERTFFDTARAAGLARFVTIGALHDEHIGRIARHVFAERGLEVPEAAVERVLRVASGNPLHAIEAALSVSPSERPQACELPLRAPRSDPARESFSRSATERLGGLSPQARLVAGALAVAGRPFSEYDLAGVTKLSIAELAAATRELEEAGFVRRSGANLAFAHEQYLTSILEHIDDHLRQKLHRRLATALVRLATTRSMARYEVAQHLEAAGQPKQALAQALLAAGHAASVGALRERSAALELADRVAIEDRADIVLDLAACYLHLKEFDKLARVCAAAGSTPQASSELELNVHFFEIAAAHDSGRASLGRTCDELVALLAQGRAFRHEFEARTMLMRTADKSGRHLLARRAARELRKRAEAHNAIDAAAFRLLSSGYIAAKHYWPRKALPLLERALLEAQRTHNWGVELLCRDGIGAVLKQLGRYQASAQHIQFGLALARKTLNPQAEALALNNLAVTEIAMGNMASADRHLLEAAQIDSTYPAWPFRAYRLVNQGVLRLLQGAPAEARVHFVDAHDLSRDRELWSVLLCACGGLAMCAVRRGDHEDLGKWCEALYKYSGGREDALSDGALVESAIAWNTCVNAHNPAGALSRLMESVRMSARRDIDHWLALRMEEIRLREWIHNRPERERREGLADECETFGADGIARHAASLP